MKATSTLQISPSHVVLLHDELDLPLGKFKVKHGGSANGHNGVIDTQERLKFNDVKRLRIGIGMFNLFNFSVWGLAYDVESGATAEFG